MTDLAKECTVRLTPEETARYAEELAGLVGDYERLDEERRKVGAQYRENLKSLHEKIVKLAEAIRDGEEKRTVPCREEPDWGNKLMRLIRSDTGQVVATRGLTPEELQGALFRQEESA
jgi:hypothetical protein